MKKIFSVLAVLLAVSLIFCGCKGKNDKKTDDKTDKKPQDDTSVSQGSPADDFAPGTIDPILFCDEFEGTWTADSGEFIDFAIENNKATLLFADWSSDDYSKIAEITSVSPADDGAYSVVLLFPEYIDANGNAVSVKETKRCTVTDLKNGYISIEIDEKATDYFYDGRQQYPL